MPDDRRSTFSAAKPDDQGRYASLWSFNPGNTKMLLSILSGSAALFLLMLGALVWFDDFQFDKRIKEFHDVAKPSIELMIEETVRDQIELHRRSGVHPGALTEAEITREVSDLKLSIVALQSSVDTLQQIVAHQTELMEDILRNQRNGS